jgi:heat-inducible transcriptional repressor
MELSERKQELLLAIIRSYILNGEPVGSKSLRENESLNLSSATIRSEMSDLCEMGYLVQPHTSAGRVPTPLGYRFYIDHLNANPTEQEKMIIDSLLPDDVTQADRLIDIACGALADLTSSTALLSTPAESDAEIKNVQIISLGSRTVMAIMVSSHGTVKNRVVRCDSPIDSALLARLQEILSKELCGIPVSQISGALLQGILIKLGLDGLKLAPVIGAISDIAGEIANSSIKIWGEVNLLTSHSFSSDQATRMIEYLRRMNGFQAKIAAPFEVLFGSDTGEDVLSSSGMIVTTYNWGTKTGTIGILGPDRMDYARIIPSVLYFSESLGKLLSGNSDSEVW